MENMCLSSRERYTSISWLKTVVVWHTPCLSSQLSLHIIHQECSPTQKEYLSGLQSTGQRVWSVPLCLFRTWWLWTSASSPSTACWTNSWNRPFHSGMGTFCKTLKVGPTLVISINAAVISEFEHSVETVGKGHACMTFLEIKPMFRWCFNHYSKS